IPAGNDLVIKMGTRPCSTDGKQFGSGLRQGILNVPLGFLKMLRRFRNGVTLNQYVFTAKLVLRIAPFRRISMRSNAVMEIENLGRIAQRFIDLLFRPDIECAFGGLV